MKKFLLASFLITGCAGFNRSCSSLMAENFGSDWLIAQYGSSGVINCWRLPSTSVTNEHASDGIYWQASGGHLVHIAGWYSRVQVSGGDWAGAAKALGVSLESCR